MTIGAVQKVAHYQAAASKQPPTQEQLLAQNAKATKILVASMIALPAATGVSLLGVKGLDKLASATTGVVSRLARGGATGLAAAGAIAGLGAVAAVAWGPIALIAAQKERGDILQGKNPYGN